MRLRSAGPARSAHIRAQSASTPPSIFSRGSRRLPRVALTIDDCHLSYILQRMENTLADNPDMRVTFFPTGEALLSIESKLPGVWKRIAEQGHDIGYHSYSHINPQLFSNQAALEDYDRWREALNKVLSKETRVYFARPPYGNASPSFLNLCGQRGLICTLWSWGWGGADAQDTAAYTMPKTKNGDVVLMHTRSVDAAVFAQGLPWLKSQGKQAVTLRQLYYDFRKEQIDAEGCEVSEANSLTRTCDE